LDCMDAHLPNQANNYGVVPDGRERCSVWGVTFWEP
jgi:hypothetical protein